jgi:hypothetical protein
LYFGERPLCTVLRPRFLLPEQFKYLRGANRPLLSSFEKISRRAVIDDEFQAQFGLYDWEQTLIKADPGFDNHAPLTRLDAFFVTENNELRFTEYNAEVPAASAYNDVLNSVFYGLPVMGVLCRSIWCAPCPRATASCTCCCTCTKNGAVQERPNIAILDWVDVPTRSEFELFTQYFKAQGFESRIIDPRETEYKNGKLVAGDFTIDVIYKRVLITELIERCGLDSPVVQAVQERAVCMVNPFRCKLLYKKLSLAVLSDEQNAAMFSEDELRAIKAHIPWTRRVEERHTTYGGLPIDLVPFMLKYQQQLVLKPNDDYGGRGIVLGWQTNTSGWEKAVADALKRPPSCRNGWSFPKNRSPASSTAS